MVQQTEVYVHNARLDVYKSELAADQALVRRQALRYLMSALQQAQPKVPLLDESRKEFNPSALDGNHEWRSCSVFVFQVERFVVRRYKDRDDENRRQVEENNPNVNTSNRSWHVSPWVSGGGGGCASSQPGVPGFVKGSSLGFTSSDCDNFSSNKAPCSCGQDIPVPQELTLGAVNVQVLYKWARIFPVSEANPVVCGRSSKVDDDSQYNQSDDGQNLDLRPTGG